MSKSDRGQRPSPVPPSHLPPPPWSVPVPVAEIPDVGLSQAIEARPDERKAMAELGGLPGIGAVKAELRLLPVRGGTVHVTGRVTGKVTQICVVSLDPVENEIDEDVDVVFAPSSQIRELAESMDDDDGESDDERPDPPEPIENGVIDLGKLVTDALFLGLDPYPRKPDAVFEDQVEAPNPDEHPFAALKALQDAAPKPKKT
ncbi:DUF177 domain-containing protein [Tardiphaga alba]|uniref:DUF177 domain-containing protein n=1 Tax=Tardiphaga alba TaxID=340268 RepID=A0ABX8AD11_9BRAD|nr:DUF177 domain-containing protein [Tardiphaga alba]QUS40270.1 DUF177 domain-containing protein [Tardiphaga alba]